MSQEGRQDLYRLAALLSELVRVLDPLRRGSTGDFRVEMVPPPPLPPTGIPGVGGGQPPGRAPARTAAEWANLAPVRRPRRAPPPLPPWTEAPAAQAPVTEPPADAAAEPGTQAPENANRAAAPRPRRAGPPLPVPAASGAPDARSPPPTPAGAPEPNSPPAPPRTPPGIPAATIRPADELRIRAVPPPTSRAAAATGSVATTTPPPATSRTADPARPLHDPARPLHDIDLAAASPAPGPGEVPGGGERRGSPASGARPLSVSRSIGRVPPPTASPSRSPDERPPAARSPPQPPSGRAPPEAYPLPRTGEPITIVVPAIQSAPEASSVDLPPADTGDLASDDAEAVFVRTNPDARLLIWRGRMLGMVAAGLRDAARARFERRFVSRLALRLP